jgi:hypothetical protein
MCNIGIDFAVGITSGLISGGVVWFLLTHIYGERAEQRRWFIDYKDRYCRYLSRIVDELDIYKNNKTDYEMIIRLIADEPNRITKTKKYKKSTPDDDLYSMCRALLLEIKFYQSHHGEYPSNSLIDEWMEKLVGYAARAWQICLTKKQNRLIS